MDNTRHKAQRQPTMPASLSEARAQRALYAMAKAQAELHETGDVRSDILDWAMADLSSAMRRCQLYMREAGTCRN